MLSKTITIQKIIDAILLNLWYAEQWRTTHKIPAQANLFEAQATGLVILLYNEVGLSGPHVEYKGISIPEPWLPYLQEREKFYLHP